MNISYINNGEYRDYVSEQTKINIGRDNSFKDIYVGNLKKEFFPHYRGGGNVKGSHLYPNYKTTFIETYEFNRVLPSTLLKQIDNTIVYDIAGKGYKRSTMPNKMKSGWE